MIDYKKIGFKSGLEIHQQLDTRKLFCNCPSILRKDEPDYEVKRRLHVIAGESGEVDVAVLHEGALGKEFTYQGYDTTCLVELDEEPPHEINNEALKIALHIAFLFNCEIQSITQVMRKTVIDGSNTSGFQRSVMIARDGFVETSKGRVGIDTIFLEEDSARPVERNEKGAVYRLDRLGIPLVEIATEPGIKDAEHAKETALKIGEIMRAAKVKRGIGTIRQDINISIKGGNRVELKGFQDPKIMIKTVENEVRRQLEFSEKGEKNPAEVRNVLADGTSEFMRPMPGASRMYPETDLPILKISREMINEAKKTLPRLREEIEEELRKQGLSEEYIKLLFKEGKVDEYREAYYNLPKPNLIGNLLLVFPKDVAKKKGREYEEIDELIGDNFNEVVKLVNEGKIKEEDIRGVLENLIEGMELKDAIKIEKVEASEIEEKIHDIIRSKPGLTANAYMGIVMKELKGRVNPSNVMDIIRKFLE